MACAMKPQRKGMAVGSGGFQACPNLWNVVFFEHAGQLSRALGHYSQSQSALFCRRLFAVRLARFSWRRPSPAQGVNQWISRWSSFFPFVFFGVLVIGRFFARICSWRTAGIGDMLVCALFVG